MMATQPQAKKNQGGNLKKQLAAEQLPPGKNTVEANTIPQLAAWRQKFPIKKQAWTRG